MGDGWGKPHGDNEDDSSNIEEGMFGFPVQLQEVETRFLLQTEKSVYFPDRKKRGNSLDQCRNTSVFAKILPRNFACRMILHFLGGFMVFARSRNTRALCGNQARQFPQGPRTQLQHKWKQTDS